MSALDDLVAFALWLKRKGFKLDDLDADQLRQLARDFWDMMHGED